MITFLGVVFVPIDARAAWRTALENFAKQHIKN
jgi:hypothetical protein